MFYFKITVRWKNGDGPCKSRNYYREALFVEDIGVLVGTKLRPAPTMSVSVTKISQAAYMRATRGSE